MSYNTPGFGFEEDDHPLASAFGFEGISDSFGAVDELAEIVWRKGPVAKQFVPPSSRMTETARSEDIRDSDTEAAARSGPGASRLFVEEGEMASWLYLTQDATDIGTAIPPTELGRQSTAAKMVSQVEAPRRESTEVGSSATPEVERALPAASRRVTVVDSNKSPGTCEVGSSATPEVERLPTAISRPTAAVDSSRFPWTCEERSAAAAAASSSGGSGGAGRTIHAAEDRKHKLHDSDDSDPEDAEYDSESKNHANLRSRKRTRSAEVHNLSERRRRDRINEKMKALQQLIPQCSKTDKASMLDDAVEYMKSLQLQIQMMRGRAPMTFPCFPQHTPPMGMAISGMGMDSNARNFIPNVWPYSPFMMGSAISIPTSVQSAGSIQMPAYFPAMLTVNGQLPYQPAIQQDPNSINFQALNPARRSAIPDPYHQFLGLHQMQIPQQNQTLAEHGGKNESNTIKTENPEHDL